MIDPLKRATGGPLSVTHAPDVWTVRALFSPNGIFSPQGHLVSSIVSGWVDMAIERRAGSKMNLEQTSVPK